MADYENSDYLVVYDPIKNRKRKSMDEAPMNIICDDSVAFWGLLHAFNCRVNLRATFGTKARTLTLIEFNSAI